MCNKGVRWLASAALSASLASCMEQASSEAASEHNQPHVHMMVIVNGVDLTTQQNFRAHAFSAHACNQTRSHPHVP